MYYSLPNDWQKNAAKNVDCGHGGGGGQQNETVLFTFENVENVGRSLNAMSKLY